MDLKEAIERNVAQTSVWSKNRISSFIHHYHDRDVKIEGLELRHDGTDGSMLLNNCNLSLLHGHVYGLIGRNGVGKTTLMRHVAEHRILGLPPHLRCVYIDDESHQIGMVPVGSAVAGRNVEKNAQGAAGGEDATTGLPLSAAANPKITALEYLLGQHKAQIAAQQALKEALEGDEEADIEAIEAACETLAALEADKAEARAAKILESLGISSSTELNTLSGGWLHRASLAAALFVESDILLLDEPTNHLDIHGIAWLEQYLQSISDDVTVEGDKDGKAKAAKKGAAGALHGNNKKDKRKNPVVIVISHDFNFLDNICTNVLAFENSAIVPFGGNYSRYLETKQAKLQKHERMYKAQEKRRRSMVAAIEHLQQKATANPNKDLGGQITARQKLLKHRLGASLDGTYWKYGLMGPRPEILAPVSAEPIEFSLSTDVSDVPEGSGKGETILVQITDGGFRYKAVGHEKQYEEDGSVAQPGPSADAARSSMFNHLLNISVSLSSRLALVGRNGTGKSTILKLLAGELQLTEGDRLAWSELRVSFLSQHSITAARAGPQGKLTPLEFILAEHSSTAQRAEAVKLLQKFGIFGILAEESKMSVLSAGQRARVLLANALWTKPHILLLDEPTSHLDAETSSALSVALEDFEGAVIVASHDVTFIENLGGSLFCTDPDNFGWYDHPVSTYHSQLVHEKKAVDRQLVTEAEAKKAPAPVHSAALAVAAKPSDTTPLPPKSTPAPKSVGCRHCGGNHFSYACPDRPEEQKKGILMPDDYDNNAWRYKNQPQPKPKADVILPKMIEKANDGGGDWKVAVTKSTLKRLKKGL